MQSKPCVHCNDESEVVKLTNQKSTKVLHTTSFFSLRFSIVITMLTLPLLFTYLTLSKQL